MMALFLQTVSGNVGNLPKRIGQIWDSMTPFGPMLSSTAVMVIIRPVISNSFSETSVQIRVDLDSRLI